MIDKEGRLFGKISIIDIVTILLVIIGGYFFLKQLGVFASTDNVGTTLDDIEVVFYQEEVNNFAAKSIEIGDPTLEALKNASFGEVVDIEIGESISWDQDPDGHQVGSSREGYSSIYITMQTKGKIGSNGIILDGDTYHIGDTINLKVGNSIFYGDIASAEKIQEVK